MAPPPPPLPCFPSFKRTKGRRLSWSSAGTPKSYLEDQMYHHPSTSQTAINDADSLAFHTDSEMYDEIPERLPKLEADSKGRPKLQRSNTMTGTKKSMLSAKFGYGWGLGRKLKDKEAEAEAEADIEPSSSRTILPVYEPPTTPPTRSNTKSSFGSNDTKTSKRSHSNHQPPQHVRMASPSPSPRSSPRNTPRDSLQRGDSQRSQATQSSRASRATKSTHHSNNSRVHTPGTPPAGQQVVYPNDSSSTLVGSALERKMAEDDSIRDTGDMAERLEDLRRHMAIHKLDYYIVPSEDAHGSEFVAESDQRRHYISGFYGSAGDAVITMSHAYLFVDSRYWLQAKGSLDRNWTLMRAGSMEKLTDWIDWLSDQVKDTRVGIDARMISYEKAIVINEKINKNGSKLVYPPQNLVDLVWKDKPQKPKAPIFPQPIEFAGVSAATKLVKLREWISNQPPSVPSYQTSPPSADQYQVGTLITSLSCIAYLLNLRGSDIPHNPLFHAYLYVGLDNATIFIDSAKVTDEMDEYLKNLGIDRREYLDLWTFLRRRDWSRDGKGKVLISPETSYAISLMLTHYRYTVAPSWAESAMAIKNETELEGLRRAYIRDGASFVRFLAWIESKLNDGYDISEWEAAFRLTEFRRQNKFFMGVAYKSISAAGPNSALPHYTPRKSNARMIDRETPYLNDSGGQYRDGTCDTTRTVHFGRPTSEMCEAFTRVLQGHIAIDSAVFPKGTSGYQLDVLARKALWKGGQNYMHGTGHGFGSFLTVHEGKHGFSSNLPLTFGHVVTNEPGFYNEGKWGMRIESALAVRRVEIGNKYNENDWLGFERLTCVPIQTRMVKEGILTKEEKAWLKEHNQRCYEKLAPLLKDDKRALKWLKREAERGIGLAQGPGGMNIDWD